MEIEDLRSARKAEELSDDELAAIIEQGNGAAEHGSLPSADWFEDVSSLLPQVFLSGVLRSNSVTDSHSPKERSR
jgi:hypothetical protein